MGLDEFKLCVDDQCFSGQKISGYVRIICGTDLTYVNRIQVKVVGFANIRWTEYKEYRRFAFQQNWTTHENHEDILSTKSIVKQNLIVLEYLRVIKEKENT